MNHRSDAPVRSVADVGPGDYVKVDGAWYRIEINTAWGLAPLPKRWTVYTDDGRRHDSYDYSTERCIQLYAKAEDFA